MSNVKKRIKKQEKSLKGYVDELFEQNSKILVVRVDLAYKKPFSEEITMEESNKYISRMLNNRRSKPSVFEGNNGYIIKKEFTEDKGVHCHAFFFYDGQKVQNDSFKADQIGKTWENITESKGCYHNCNRNKSKYENNGIGMIDHNDEEKRRILIEDAISYVLKEEQDIDVLKKNKKFKSLVRGIVSKDKSKKK